MVRFYGDMYKFAQLVYDRHMELETEKKFKCPYCAEQISMLLDLSERGIQTYIEDCEVCCQPIQITFEASNGELLAFSRTAAQ